MATQQVINVGTTPNDGAGDPLRIAYQKINNNFSNLFATFTNVSNNASIGTEVQVIFETPANTFTSGEMLVYAVDPETDDSQTVKIIAQVNSANDAVKFTAFGSVFFGNAVATYDMDVADGNIRLLSTPLTANAIFYNIGSQNVWAGEYTPGLEMAVDGYEDFVFITEDGFIMATEQP